MRVMSRERLQLELQLAKLLKVYRRGHTCRHVANHSVQYIHRYHVCMDGLTFVCVYSDVCMDGCVCSDVCTYGCVCSDVWMNGCVCSDVWMDGRKWCISSPPGYP